jgi:hypothetical protein
MSLYHSAMTISCNFALELMCSKILDARIIKLLICSLNFHREVFIYKAICSHIPEDGIVTMCLYT